MEENEKSTGSTLAKVLMIIGLATVVATVVTIICKKVVAKKHAALATEDETIDDYEECCFDCDESDDCIDADDEEITE